MWHLFTDACFEHQSLFLDLALCLLTTLARVWHVATFLLPGNQHEFTSTDQCDFKEGSFLLVDKTVFTQMAEKLF